MSKIRLAVVGVGRMGCIRLKSAYRNPKYKITHIVETIQKEKAKKLAKKYDAEVIQNLDEILSLKQVDAVWVSTGTSDHFKTILKCLKTKIPVATEKPVSETPEQIVKLYDMASCTPFFCSFQRRFDDSYLGLKKNLDKIGHLQSGNVIFRDHPMPSREFLLAGGDVFVDLTVHDIDYIRFATGQEPNFVWARSFTFDPILRLNGVKEAAKFTLVYPSDLSVSMDISRISSYGYDNSLEFSGELGCLQVSNPFRSSLQTLNSNGYSKDVYSYSFPERFETAFQNEVDHFAEVITNNADCRVTRLDCIRSLQIALATSRSDSIGHGLHFDLENENLRFLD